MNGEDHRVGEPAALPRGWVRGQGWGPWGDDDQIGAQNGLDEALVKHAVLGMVKKGKVYDLDPGRFNGMAIHWFHPPYMLMRYHCPAGFRADRGLFGTTFTETDPRAQIGLNELVIGSQHTGAHVDALCHITVGKYPGEPDDPDNGYFYNGFSVLEHAGDLGIRKADIASMPPLVSRGVLVDVYGYFESRDEQALLDGDHEVTQAELEAILAWEGVDINPGDCVLIRTGIMRYWKNWPEVLEHCYHSVGPGCKGAAFLVQQKGAVFVASDTLVLEHHPEEPGQGADPVHVFLLVEQGVHIGECFWLEDLAKDHTYEFLFIVSPLKLEGGTGSMVRPIAIS